MRELEHRLGADPEDYIALAKLSDVYLERHRETSDASYVALAERAARGSLAILPAEHNIAALDALIHVEMAKHAFASARAHAELLVSLRPSRASAHVTLGDVLIELGDYTAAASRLARAAELVGLAPDVKLRLARLDVLQGAPERAVERVASALATLEDATGAPKEAIAWCRWQLAEIHFSLGAYAAAEREHRAALAMLPAYPRSLAGLARARAAQGDTDDAMRLYERAIAIAPELESLAAVADLYAIAGRAREEADARALLEQIVALAGGATGPHARTVARLYADRDVRADVAYAAARAEYDARPDIYGADTLAWAALKTGRLDEAQAAMREALRLGTRDARLHYHAGLIARAAGDEGRARMHLERALEISPAFDPRHAPLAREALAELSERGAAVAAER
jgi:tetratricopeptide (TPR) repeat protein